MPETTVKVPDTYDILCIRLAEILDGCESKITAALDDYLNGTTA